MSEEKLYAVKNDEGKYWDFSGKVTGFWARSEVEVPATDDKDLASALAMGCGDCVVTFVEEPEKVVLTKEQAKIVEKARVSDIPATYISACTNEYNGEESLLINAYVNGYTVAKEKKYVVYKVLGGKQDKDNHNEYAQACRSFYHPETMVWVLTNWIIDDQSAWLTEKEIADFGLQDCEKEEVTDDDD